MAAECLGDTRRQGPAGWKIRQTGRLIIPLTCRRWLRAAGQAEVAVGCSGPGSWAGRGPGCWGRLRRLSAAVVPVAGLAEVLAAGAG